MRMKKKINGFSYRQMQNLAAEVRISKNALKIKVFGQTKISISLAANKLQKAIILTPPLSKNLDCL